jgi:hypothetical protein
MSYNSIMSSAQEPDEKAAPLKRRRWEAELPREEIAQLLADRDLTTLLERLVAARARWGRDLELLRSIRVLEDHLKVKGK